MNSHTINSKEAKYSYVRYRNCRENSYGNKYYRKAISAALK